MCVIKADYPGEISDIANETLPANLTNAYFINERTKENMTRKGDKLDGKFYWHETLRANGTLAKFTYNVHILN